MAIGFVERASATHHDRWDCVDGLDIGNCGEHLLHVGCLGLAEGIVGDGDVVRQLRMRCESLGHILIADLARGIDLKASVTRRRVNLRATPEQRQ